MSNWYSLVVGDGINAYAPTRAIKDAFWLLHLACSSPPDMGVYSRYDSRQNEVTIYFTPSCKQLAEQFGARECIEPSFAGLSFIAGPHSCLAIWPIGKGE